MTSGTTPAVSGAATSSTNTTRLTRGALKKLTNTSETTDQTLLEQYTEFQHGLPTPKPKRRRLGSTASESTTENDHDAVGEQENQLPVAEETKMAVTDTSTTAMTQPNDDEPIGRACPIVDDRVPAATPTVAEIALDQDEKKLDGAPEGELFVVTVLPSSEIKASTDVDAEVEIVTDVLAIKTVATGDTSEEAKDEKEVSWAKEYAALDSLRRLAIHHPECLALLLKETENRVINQLVCPSAMNLRSAMVRNALLCIQDIVVATKQDGERFYGDIIPVLLQRAANEKQFIRDLACETLMTCVEISPNEALLIELLKTSTTERNAQIVNTAGLYAQKCIGRMDKSKLKTFVLTTHENFMEEMSAFLNCKVVECKTAARRTLQYLRKHVGDTEFTTLIKAKLEGTAQFEVLKASEVKKPGATKSGLPKLSMRERMMQMKKQQTDTTASTEVVVLVPDTTR